MVEMNTHNVVSQSKSRFLLIYCPQRLTLIVFPPPDLCSMPAPRPKCLPCIFSPDYRNVQLPYSFFLCREEQFEQGHGDGSFNLYTLFVTLVTLKHRKLASYQGVKVR